MAYGTTTPLTNDLHCLLNRVVLGGRRNPVSCLSLSDLRYALEHASNQLGLEEETIDTHLYEVRLRLALHFSPVTGIKYDRGNPVPRYRVIWDYIRSSFPATAVDNEHFARDIARVLDDWDSNRSKVGGYKSRLLSDQDNRCATCGVQLHPTPTTVFPRDEYKPYFRNGDYLAPTVDHIEPVSGYGTNRLENLQVLCALCNWGKGDGLGFSIRKESIYAAEPISLIPPQHRISLVYRVIEAHKRKCALSGVESKFAELTIRKIREDGAFVRSNLHPVSLACLV